MDETPQPTPEPQATETTEPVSVKRATQSAEPPPAVKLEIYEGPLDLLLDLIRKQQINIYDIPIAKITKGPGPAVPLSFPGLGSAAVLRYADGFA